MLQQPGSADPQLGPHLLSALVLPALAVWSGVYMQQWQTNACRLVGNPAIGSGRAHTGHHASSLLTQASRLLTHAFLILIQSSVTLF